MRISNELRVGIMFFTGLVMLVLLIITMTRWGQGRNAYTFTVRFTQAQGIQEGADVRVAGVKVGQVSAVSLDPTTNVALVTLRVDHRVRLYTGYSYTIGIGGLVGERYIEITPTKARGKLVTAGEQIDGNTSADINDLIANANTVITKLSTTADSLNDIVGDKKSQQDLKEAIAGLKSTSASSAKFAATLNAMAQRNQYAIDYIVADLSNVAGDIRRVSDTLTPQLTNTKFIQNLERASANTVHLTERLDRIAGMTDLLVNDPAVAQNLKDSVAHLKQASIDLEGVMADAHTAAAALPKVTANIEAASADLPQITRPFREVAPETAENMRDISANLRQTSETVGGVAQRITRLGGELSALNIEPEARIMSVVAGDSGMRSDLNVNFRSKTTLFRLGVADIGNKSDLNLQFGNKLDENLWFRYGIVQSSFGLGADYQPNPNTRISTELFDPSRLRANALVDFRLRPLGPRWWFTAGGYDLFDRNNLGVGLTYRP